MDLDLQQESNGLNILLNQKLISKNLVQDGCFRTRFPRKSIIKNVNRLVCANATIRGNSAIIEKNQWQPNFEMPGNREIFEAVLRKQLLSGLEIRKYY